MKSNFEEQGKIFLIMGAISIIFPIILATYIMAFPKQGTWAWYDFIHYHWLVPVSLIGTVFFLVCHAIYLNILKKEKPRN